MDTKCDTQLFFKFSGCVETFIDDGDDDRDGGGIVGGGSMRGRNQCKGVVYIELILAVAVRIGLKDEMRTKE